MKKIKKDLLIEIKAVFGSEFQAEVHLDSLNAFLKAWKDSAEHTHKGNKIDSKLLEVNISEYKPKNVEVTNG